MSEFLLGTREENKAYKNARRLESKKTPLTPRERELLKQYIDIAFPLHRRRFLTGLAGAAGLTAVGYFFLRNLYAPESDQNAAETRALGSLFPDVQSHFPEMGARVAIHEPVNTGRSTSDIYNFTTVSIDQRVVNRTYLYLDAAAAMYASKQDQFRYAGLPNARVQIKSRPPRRLVFLLSTTDPESSLYPENPQGVDYAVESYRVNGHIIAHTTHADSEPIPNISFIRLLTDKEFVDNKDNLIPPGIFIDNAVKFNAFSFVTEACQSTIEVQSSSFQNTNTIQEVLCNSLAFALVYRMYGENADQYVSDANKYVTTTPDGQQLPLIPVTKDTFNSLSSEPLFR